jgi:hypothetical protein
MLFTQESQISTPRCQLYRGLLGFFSGAFQIFFRSFSGFLRSFSGALRSFFFKSSCAKALFYQPNLHVLPSLLGVELGPSGYIQLESVSKALALPLAGYELSCGRERWRTKQWTSIFLLGG